MSRRGRSDLDGREDTSINFRGWRHYGYKVGFDFELRVPRRTALLLKTVNGKEITVLGTTGKFEVDNINGGVDLTELSGSGRAYALNGKVHVRFASNPQADSYFGSLNGNVEVAFRPQLSAELRLKTFSGKVYSDFPVSHLPPTKPLKKTQDGKFIYKSGDSAGFRIGEGGPELSFDAFNGNILILSQEK